MFENQNNEKETFNHLFDEPIIYQHVFKIPVVLRIILITIFGAIILVPILLVILKSGKSDDVNNIFMVIVFIPAIVNVLTYKKYYVFTNTGIYTINKGKKQEDSEPTASLLMRWDEYNYYSSFFLGYRIFKGEDKMASANEPIEDNKLHIPVISTKPVFILATGEDASQLEYLFLSRSILPKTSY